MKYLMVGIGGFLGANARYLVSSWAAQHLGVTFPYGTLLANLSGSFFLGIGMTVLQNRALLQSNYHFLFAIGFLGAYTTFSTFSYESLRFLQEGSVLPALVNIFGSVAVGLFGVFLGMVLGRFV